jgi:hypothetical protein
MSTPSFNNELDDVWGWRFRGCRDGGLSTPAAGHDARGDGDISASLWLSSARPRLLTRGLGTDGLDGATVDVDLLAGTIRC